MFSGTIPITTFSKYRVKGGQVEVYSPLNHEWVKWEKVKSKTINNEGKPAGVLAYRRLFLEE